MPSDDGARVSPKILIDIYRQNNQSLPEVKALTSERLRKCRSRIDQAVHDGCLEQYLADFTMAAKKAQQTPFLRGEGARGWRASFDWFVANHINVYAVIEGKYDGPAAASNNGNGGGHASDKQQFAEEPSKVSGLASEGVRHQSKWKSFNLARAPNPVRLRWSIRKYRQGLAEQFR